MFSPGTKRAGVTSRSQQHHSPATPTVDNRSSSHHSSNIIPNRPSTGTPAPWAPRLSVLARVPQVNGIEKAVGADPTKPVYVGEFPQVVRDEQASLLQRRVPVEASVSGGLEKEASLAWIICGNKLFLWSYLSPAPSKFVVLEFPQDVVEAVDIGKNSANSWLLSFINWDQVSGRIKKPVKQIKPAGIVLCNKRTRAVIYWHNILEENAAPLTSFASSNESKVASPDGTTTRQRQQRHKLGSSWNASHDFNSLIASAIPDCHYTCIALACSSNGELWQFHCSPAGINRRRITEAVPHVSQLQGYPRSLIWRLLNHSVKNLNREFFLLTDREIQCFNISLDSEHVSKLWSQEIIGTDGDLGMKKDLAGQKEIWPLDFQVDSCGKVITILVAVVCKDRISSSSYMQYSLLSMQYASGIYKENTHERALEKKAPIQVIIPKARAEENLSMLFSMRLRVGGKPPGSAIIISGDGTATVSHYFRNDTLLYQFDLPYDGGKVLDASVLCTGDDDDEGSWVILTEKAGIWAIPERAVVVGGVKPPERSLSRKGSSNESSAEEERRNLAFAGDIVPRRASSDGWDAAERQRVVPTGIGRRSAQDEESEAFLTHLFNEYLSSGQVDNLLEKLQTSGAFEKEGGGNVFARVSKSIVDTLAKHWTTTRGAEILVMAVVSSQLLEKQQKHQKFLEFLALSKCHEELCSRQRHALQNILEHGEKLAALIQLREMQNLISQNRSSRLGSPNASVESQMSGALWDLIQLVGEQARRTTVLLMDRDNAEVFYSKVSGLEDLFDCLEKELECLISPDQPFAIQIQRSCELANACVAIVQAAFYYKTEHHLWYPPPEGLTPWYCQSVVRNGLWSIASFMLEAINDTYALDKPTRSYLFSNLEDLAEVLLEAYASAVSARIENGEEHDGLLNEYWKRRDALLDALYEQAKDFARTSSEDLNGVAEQHSGEAILNISAKLVSLAKRHGCYTVLWRITCDINDSMLLRNLMHETTGPDGGFSHFVFKQLYEKRQLSRLLRLGEEFPEELSIFLKHHEDLLWLHELYIHHFSPASETLHMLALSQEKSSRSAFDDEERHHNLSLELKLSERKRLLHLAKIAAMAGKNADSVVDINRIEADLKILKLQEEIVKLISPSEAQQHVGEQLLHPDDLINLCLKGEKPELILWAFDVFAWTSCSFRMNNRSLLEECWKNAADQDDWSKLHEAYEYEGWSDEELMENLSNTILFQASSRCYGPQAETFEEGFDHVLPLRSDVLEQQMLKDICPSVEVILMEHKSFPEAGKLMIMALMLGSEQGSSKLEEDLSPME